MNTKRALLTALALSLACANAFNFTTGATIAVGGGSAQNGGVLFSWSCQHRGASHSSSTPTWPPAVGKACPMRLP